MPAAPSSSPPASGCELLDRELLVVTGKGGVGKSTVAAALAWAATRQGKRVLACELDAKGDLDACLMGSGRAIAGPSTFTPSERQPGLFVMAMDPEESLKEYMRLTLKLPLVSRVGFLSGVFDFVANAAPGVREIVTIGKVAYEVREAAWDLVVVDATSTGHVISQLDAPNAINALVGAGLIRGQTAWIRDILVDPQRTGVVAVTTSEEMPVVETIELIGELRDRVNVDLAALVVNRVLPEPFTRNDEAVFDRMCADGGVALAARLGLGSTVQSVRALIESNRLAVGLRRSREPHLQQLLGVLDSSVVTAFVPALTESVPGLATTAAVADHLGDEFGW